eukprot:gene13413-13541_t
MEGTHDATPVHCGAEHLGFFQSAFVESGIEFIEYLEEPGDDTSASRSSYCGSSSQERFGQQYQSQQSEDKDCWEEMVKEDKEQQLQSEDKDYWEEMVKEDKEQQLHTCSPSITEQDSGAVCAQVASFHQDPLGNVVFGCLIPGSSDDCWVTELDAKVEILNEIGQRLPSDLRLKQRKLVERLNTLEQAEMEHLAELIKAKAAQHDAESCLQEAKRNGTDLQFHLDTSRSEVKLLNQQLQESNTKEQQAAAESGCHQWKLTRATADMLVQANTITDQKGVIAKLQRKLNSNDKHLLEERHQVSVLTALCDDFKQQREAALQENAATQKTHHHLQKQIREGKQMWQAARTCQQVAERDRDEAVAQAKEFKSQLADHCPAEAP